MFWPDLESVSEVIHKISNERRGPRGPQSCSSQISCQLEGKFGHQSDGASVAGKYRLRVIENGIARSEIVQITRAVRSSQERSYVIDSQPPTRIAARNVLGVIQNVGELRTETEFEPLRNAYVLVCRERKLVGWLSRQRVAPPVASAPGPARMYWALGLLAR